MNSGNVSPVDGSKKLANERDLTKDGKWENACNSYYDNSLAGYNKPAVSHTNDNSNVLALQAQADYVEGYDYKDEYYSGWHFNEMNYRDRYTLIANRNIP